MTPAHWLVVGSHGDRSLELLAEDVRIAREEVGNLRRGPIAHDRLLAARQALLRAMESFAAELTARGLPIPPRLRDDLRLQQNLRRLRDPSRTRV